MQTPRGLNWGRDAEGWTKIGLASASRESWVSDFSLLSAIGEGVRVQHPPRCSAAKWRRITQSDRYPRCYKLACSGHNLSWVRSPSR
jgi:hypothetical protein